MMAGYLRLYLTAVDPADLDEMRRLFHDDVQPPFTGIDGCLHLELVVSVEKNAGGLVEAGIVSRWASVAAMDAAFGSRGVVEGIVRFRELLRQEPVIKVFEISE
ncbi:MAG: antibiotic biosynthesis monooxygenase family protein [Acidimicrobiales bacterium]